MLSDADRAYVEEQFVPLAALCAENGRDVDAVRAAIAARELPGFPYPGLEYVPANYFELPAPGELAGEDREAYLDGTYFVCVRDATVANIARKEELVTRVRELLDRPGPELKAAVDELDALERPFSPDYDRQRFGVPPTRDELVAGPRARYPQLWASA